VAQRCCRPSGIALARKQAELVLSTNLEYAVNWLVRSVSEAVETIVEAGGKVIIEPTQIPVGRLAVVNDPFGNALVLLDLSPRRSGMMHPAAAR
jgi:predicted enzyme related to lactoylglutathione lyase